MYPNSGIGHPQAGEAGAWHSVFADSARPIRGDIDAKGTTVCFVYAGPNGSLGGCYDAMRNNWGSLNSTFLAMPTVLVKVAVNADGSHACFLLLNSQTLLTYLICADARSISISLKIVIYFLISF